MDVTVTVHAPATGVTADVRIIARAESAAGQLLDRLREAVGAQSGTPMFAGANQLNDAATVTDCQLRTGAVLTCGEPIDPAPVPTGTDEAGPGDAIVVPLPNGQAVVRRTPRVQPLVPAVEIEFPTAPEPASRPRFSAATALAPLVTGLVLAIALGEWQFLLFMIASPVMVIAQVAGDWWTARRRARRDATAHVVATNRAAVRLQRAVDEERRHRLAAAPDLDAVRRAALRPTGMLWQRGIEDPDWLTLRLGRGDLPGATPVRGGPGQVVVADVPVCVSMPETGALGITGPRDLTAGLLRALVIQAVTLHGPGQFALAVLAPGRVADWEWVRWLPHVAPRQGEPCQALVGFDVGQCEARLAELGRRPPVTAESPPRQHTLVVVDGAHNADALLAPGGLAGRSDVSVVCTAADATALPVPCRATAALHRGSAGAALVLTAADGRQVAGVVAELVAQREAEDVARALAPLQDRGGASADLPAVVRWSRATGVDLRDPDRAVSDVQRRWGRNPATTVTLGEGVDGPAVVDLARDGPHTLVAGTTGAGKSELLQTLIAGLVLGHRPDQLALLLVDFKGGAAFGPCARLPHTCGLVTDLDAATAARALASLRAELRHRETVLAELGATDLDRYADLARHREQPTPPPPRLVIVVDEFATLVDELPEFVGGLVGIARRGRSLGVHLVLATQRPQGVVSAEIRANTGLRICLAVTRESESRDVIDSPAAAAICRTTPGRALIRTGSAELRECQVAHIGAPRANPDPVVTLSPAALLGTPPERAAVSDARGSELDALVDAAIAAAASLGCPPASPLWLPPLPDNLPLDAVPDPDRPNVLGWGLRDLPDRRRQPALELDLQAAGAVVVAGAARSGRTTAAMTIATALTARFSPDDAQLWAIDSGGGLAGLKDLPHCGAVVPATDLDRVERLIGWLTSRVAQRRRRIDHEPRHLLVIVDTWEGLQSAADGDTGRVPEAVLRLAVDGPSAGLHTIVTTDRSGLSGRLAGVAAERIVLRLADRSDFALLGVPIRDLPTDLPPGRGIRAGELSHVQISQPDPITAAASRRWRPPGNPPHPFEALPSSVRLATLPVSPPRLTIGVGGDDLATVTVDPDDTGTVLVAGPRRSGRSTALRLIARQLPPGRVALVSRRCVGTDSPGVTHLAFDDQLGAVTQLEAMRRPDGVPPHVLVDDADLLPDGALSEWLEELTAAATGDGHLTVIAATTEAATTAFRGVVARARQARVGVILHPQGPHDGDALGIVLPRRRGGVAPPGRGWWAVHGDATQVQLADPDPPAVTRSRRSVGR